MTIIVVGNVPPPVDGAGMVTAQAVGILREKLDEEVELIDCFDGQGRVWREILSYGQAAVRLFGRDVTRVYLQGVQGERMLFALVLLIVAKIAGTHVVHHHHAFKFINSPSVLWRLICSSRFDVTHVVLSPGMGEKLESTYGNSNWRVVSNAAFVRDEFLGQDRQTANDEEPVVLFVGAAGIGKGEDTLLDAIRRLREESGIPIKLVLAGRGHESNDSFVEAVGVVPSEELAALMRASALLALPSRDEAAPMVLYEASACGLPSVAANCGCIAEMSAELDGGIDVVNPLHDRLESSVVKGINRQDEKLGLLLEQTRNSATSEFLDLFERQAPEAFAGVMMSQLAGVPYRSEVFGKAAEAGCQFTWGLIQFEQHIVTAPQVAHLCPSPKKNRYFANRSLVWQSGALREMVGARVLVIDGNPRWLNTYVVAALRKLLSRPTIFWGHFGHHGEAGRIRKLTRSLYRKLPERWLAYTETEAAKFRQEGFAADAAPNPLPPCTDRAFVVSGTGNDVMFMGRIDSGKRLEDLLLGMSIHGGSRKLHIVGDGPSREQMDRLAHELGIGSRVQFHGFLPCGDELHRIMDSCRSIVIPSYVGLNLPQAMAHGLTGLINLDELHSPEIEAAFLEPSMIAQHTGGPEGIASGLHHLAEPATGEVDLASLYSSEGWIEGLRQCVAAVSSTGPVRKSPSVKGIK